MDPLLVGVVAGLIGLTLGVFGMLAFGISERSRKLTVDIGEPTLPAFDVEAFDRLIQPWPTREAYDRFIAAFEAITL